MFRSCFLWLLTLLMALACPVCTADAAEVDCDTVYCFSGEDFSQETPITGICITGVPEKGGVYLGQRILRPGDILTAEQVSRMTFCPVLSEFDQTAQVSYLPIYDGQVAEGAVMTISIRGKEDQAPVAQDSAIETYKNLPNEGKLKVSDPEGESLTFTLVRAPRRGEVELQGDGTFTYTPKKNKVGVDSFTYTAADPAGNVSREATVTVQILKPTDARQYTDTLGQECRFEAEWLRNTGLFVGENVSGESCFLPEKAVSRGEFLAMMVQLLEIPTQETDFASVPTDTPDWLKPYLAAAQRSGLLDQLPATETGCFEADAPITGAEAAVMLQNALDLSISPDALETVSAEEDAAPVWASAALTAMADNGVCLPAAEVLTRGEVSQLLYQVSVLAPDAPGTAIFRMNQ